MKRFLKIKNIIFSSLCAVLFFAGFSGCEFLQGTLSTTQEQKLLEETGHPDYEYKVWYYNGTSGEDMKLAADSSSEVFVQNLKVDFGQKVALKSYTPSGKMVINYTDSDGNIITKTINSISGRLSKDYKAFYVDMSPVTKLIDGSVTSATVDLKLSGFVSASEKQNGRPVKAFELSSLQVRPLYSTLSLDYSTVGFSTQSKILIPLKGAFSLAEGAYKLTAKDSSLNEYTFNVSAEEGAICLTPDFSQKPADQTRLTLKISGILPEGAGDSYTKEFTIKFIKHLIVIDGIEDPYWNSDLTLSVEDEQGDSKALGQDGQMYDTSADISKLYITNDEDNLYLAIKGGLSSSWNDGFALMISKDLTSDAAYTEGSKVFKLADTISYGRAALAHGQPDVYIYHQPQNNKVGAWVENGTSADDISSFIEYDQNENATFIEYSIPLEKLTSAGITRGSQIHIGAFFSAHWDAGIFAAEAVPDSIVSSTNESHSSITLNFRNGLAYTLK